MGILSTIGNALFGGGNSGTKKKKPDYTTSSGTQYNPTYHDPNQGNINMSSKDINYTTNPTTSASTTASKNNYTNAMNKVASAKYNPSSAVTAAKNGYDAAKKTVEGMEFNFSEKGKKEYEDALNYYKSLGFSESEATRQAYNAYIDGVNAKPGEYSESERVQASRSYLDSILNSKPGDFTFDDTALNDVYNKIMNREDFSFDLNSSALYQQYKDQYQALGQQAMMDTMGQASAMTGGYGSSYATSAGQQAYQNQLQNLNNIIPELYGMAMQQYQMEGQQMLDQYGIASDQRNFAYGQYRDSVADWQNDRAFAYSQYADERNFDWGQYMDKYSNWLNTQNLNLNAYSTFWGQDFNKYESELNRAGNLASMAQSDYFNYWDQEFSKYNSDLSKNIDLAKMAQGDYQYASDFDYRTFRDSVEDNKWAAGMYNSDWWNGVNNDMNIWRENNANAFNAANFDFNVASHNADSRYKYNSLNDSNAQAAAASALDNARFDWDKDTWTKEFQYKQDRDKIADDQWAQEFDLKKENSGGSQSSTATTGDEEIDKILSGYNEVTPASSLSKKSQDTWANIYLTLTEGGKRNMDEPDIRNKLIKAINAAVGEKHMTKNEAMYLIVNLIGDKN